MASSRREAAPVAPGPEWMVRVWKWGAGSLSAGAAAVSIISSVRSVTGVQQVRWIGVSPAADTAFAIGDTVQLATTITDSHGGVLPGVTVGWSSTDTSVATVDSAGTVVARAIGATTIVAAAGGRIAQSRILVRPRPAAIRIHGDTLLRLPEGGSSRVVARLVDARRHPVPGLPIAWRSSDPSVVAVDSLARLTAVTAGHTTIVATGGDLTAELAVEVYPVPATITLLAGDGQRAPAGHRLPDPIRAQIVSRGGRPLAGAVVHVGHADDTASYGHVTDTSNADGLVQIPWTLGARPGRQRIALGVEGDASITTLVTAEADPVPANTRMELVGSAPSGIVGTEVEEPIAVRVTDTTGAPLPDLPVVWGVSSGGTIAPEGTRTDSQGEARARWTLGARAGAQQAYAQVGSASAPTRVTITGAALPGPAAALTIARAAPTRGEVGRPLLTPVLFRVSDRAGNPVPGVRVTVRAASGSVAERSTVSDSTGRVAVAWTLGPVAGPQRLALSVPGIERATELVVRARAGTAKQLSLEVPASGVAGRPLAQPVTLIVSDSLRNPVAGALVVLGTRPGRVVPSSVRTDSTGRAQARWTLGGSVGEQQLVAAVKGSELKATRKIRATAPAKVAVTGTRKGKR